MDRTQVIKELKALMDAFKEERDAHPVCIEEAIRLLEMSYDDDVISRHAAIESIRECAEAAHSMHDWDMEQGYLNAIECIEEEPSAQPEVLACGEGELIAQPERTGRWIDHVEDGYVECPFCHSATNCDDNISDLHFYFSCGARMEGEG